MSKQLPYFCWFAADAETDENFKAMTDEQVGFYLRCLNHCWINGSLPASLDEAARVMGRPRAKFDRLWERVGRCFVQSDQSPSRLVNRRQEKERASAVKKSEKARASADARWMRTHCEGNARASESVSVSDFEFGSEGSAEGGGMRAEWDDQWQDFRSKYIAARPDLIDEDFLKAHHVWRVLDFSQREDSILGIAARIDAGQWDDPQFIPKPEKYLREDRKRKVLPRGSKLSRGEATSLKALEIFRRSQ